MNDALKILAFDTSSERGSVALLEGGRLRAELRADAPATHSALLLKSVDFLLERTGWKLQDLGLVASGVGPGSFTGIRIGVATGLGLAQSLGIPFTGVSGLDVLAHRVAVVRPDGRITILLDAHRNQVYFAEYESRAGRIRRVGRPALVDVSSLPQSLADASIEMETGETGATAATGETGAARGTVAGDLGDELLKTLGRSCPGLRWLPVDLFLAEGVGRLALKRKATWRTGDFLMSEPMYIRP
ncbi:MAG: tRNA (adenosine(37)-N6)-threonylcarbamoyltransferase complex dimerization subunit type 1 TsaB, partial [Acidobacteriota bacterium]|nr:tRNA (adenosine(37)-N6)-threonylcarbamoyltransferase complex dimerization subunit type 1 TsaB [Acidobacteriota bacterium]